MNYINQLNLFHEKARAVKISSAGRYLYLCLLDFNNHLAWSEGFTASDRQLMSQYGIRSMSVISKSRKELVENGFIDYIPSKKRGMSSSWRIKDLTHISAVEKGTCTNTVH